MNECVKGVYPISLKKTTTRFTKVPENKVKTKLGLTHTVLSADWSNSFMFLLLLNVNQTKVTKLGINDAGE